MRSLTCAALALSALALAACDPTDPKEDTGETGDSWLDCDAMAVYSTNVTVVSEDGAAIAEPELTWQIGGDSGESGACEGWDGAWYCGIEVTGLMTITGDAWGFDVASVEVDIPLDEDGCHPVPQDVTLTLPYIACTTEEVPSVSLTLTGDAGAVVTDPTVTYSVAGTDHEDEPCYPAGSDTWHCGYEVSGDFTISASADGFEEAGASVTVTGDECHVITEAIALVLSPVGG